MERLTKKFSDGTFYCEDIEDVGIEGINAPTYVGNAVNKLADYEDAEEQGLLLRLQFKIGQKVYYIYESCIDKSLMIGSMIYSYSCLDFPREYFATKEEAEQALKQMGE